MQTQLTDLYRNSAQGQEADKILRSCVHCGFCNATCPTYQLLGDELDGPRGRIYQIKQVLEGDPVTSSLRNHLDRCLTCRACETTCPSGVNYHQLLDIGREIVEEQLPRPRLLRLQRKLLIFVLSKTWRAQLLFFLAHLAKPALPRKLARKIPDRPKTGPPPHCNHSRSMLLLDGCVQPAATPNINAAAIRVFDRLKINLKPAAGAGCCGALPYHLSETAKAMQMARDNIDAWWPRIQQGVEAVVVTASGCAPMVKDYARLLRDDTGYKDKAARVSQLARDISEVLCNEDIAALQTAPQRIAFHSPCSLQHAQQLGGSVEQLLEKAGFTLTPVRDGYLCCGSAGTYSILQPKLSQQLRDNRLKALQEKQPELIATANTGCLLHLQSNSEVPVKHWIELLDR